MSEKYILIVDGNEKSAQKTAALLESRDYKVDLAHNGGDALQKVAQYPDLVLIDRTLPDISGLEICQTIRNNKRLQHISIIVFTIEDIPSQKAEGLRLGADDYIVQPIDSEELFARIEAVLRRNQAFRQTQGKQSALVTELKEI